MAKQGRLIAAAEVELYVDVAGEAGRPWLTCLHSLATDRRLWDAQMPVLERDFSVLRIDLRGHGRSEAGDPDYRLDLLAQDVVAIWHALGIERSAVLGLSLGGMIALQLALDVPDKVTRVVAADCRSDAPDAFRAMWAQRRALLRDGGLAAIAETTLPTWFTPATLAAAPPFVGAVRAMIEGTSPAGYIGATRALERLALKPRLPEIRRPTRFVVGAEDGLHPAAMREMCALVPGASLVEIAGAAHLSNLEQEAAFNDAVVGFLADADAA